MSFLLATLNPGKKARRSRHRRRNPFATAAGLKTAFMATANPRRRRRGRRKLTAWQSAVRKYGGVMQAVRAMRGGKHRKKRRSAVSRRSLRSRSRRALRRRPKMARVRHRRRRRTPPRGRGGRFTSRHHRRHRSRRRHHRNPVVPTVWAGNPRRRRHRSRRRRNPLFLSRRGFSGRKHRGYRQMHRRRRHPRHWHNNPVLPFFAFNGRRRKTHHRRRHGGHRRRHYSRNPVLPFFAFNPGGGADPLSSIMGRAKSLIDVKFWTETGAPAAVGFFGSKALGGLIHQYTLTQFAGVLPTSVYYPYTKALCDTLAGAGMAWGVGRFYNKKAGDAIWLGTVVNVAYSLIRQLMMTFAPGVAASMGLSGLGDDIGSRMKDAVVQRVQQNLGVYLNKRSLAQGTVRGMGTYANRQALINSTYDPGPRARMADYDVTSTDTTL